MGMDLSRFTNKKVADRWGLLLIQGFPVEPLVDN